MYLGCTIALMWIGCGIYWVWIVLVVMLKRCWSINYTLINLGKVAWYKQQGNQDWLYLCCTVYIIWICMQMVIYTHLIQSIRVLSECDYISVRWLLLHICHNFHFPERCGDPRVYIFHHDWTLMAWPLIWYYLIALYLFIGVVMGQGPHQITECCVVCE